MCRSRISSAGPRSSSSPSTRIRRSGAFGNGRRASAGTGCSSPSVEPVARRKAHPDALQERLGYSFQDPELLLRALTHVSAPNGTEASYQRLEFLGDRVLGLAIADMLYAAYPAAPEGELSRRLAELVRRETCAE